MDDEKRSRFRWRMAVLAGLGTVALVAALGRQPAAAKIDLPALHKDLRAKLDPAFPGRGTTDYPGNTVDDVPKGYAMILMAELAGNRPSATSISALAKASGKFLIERADERKDGFPGWGVPLAWDPYGDGSTNPAHTKYSISIGIVTPYWIGSQPIPRPPRRASSNWCASRSCHTCATARCRHRACCPIRSRPSTGLTTRSTRPPISPARSSDTPRSKPIRR